MVKEALLIIDMSNDFVHDEGGLTAGAAAQAIVPSIVAKADQFLQDEQMVVICLDDHEKDDPHFDIWPAHNVRGTWGQALYGELQTWYQKNRDNPYVIDLGKPDYDAFYQTDLARRLQSWGVNDVYLTGACTDICIFLTAHGAYASGFDTTVYRDATATFTSNHDLFLNQMKDIFQTQVI